MHLEIAQNIIEYKLYSIKRIEEVIKENKELKRYVNYYKSYLLVFIILQKKLPSLFIMYMELFIEDYKDKDQVNALNKINNVGLIQASLENEIITELYMIVEDNHNKHKDRTLNDMLSRNEKIIEVNKKLKELRNSINHLKSESLPNNTCVTEDAVTFEDILKCYIILKNEIISFFETVIEIKKFDPEKAELPFYINTIENLKFSTNKNKQRIYNYYFSLEDSLKKENNKKFWKKFQVSI